MNPKVSVIIPVYNTEKYLQTCLDSVINQTLKDIEIIIVNDGSTDNSLDIIRQYASKDQRIVIIDQANQGAGVARNCALDIAKGEYISFIDSDDFVEKNFLEKLYTEITKRKCDFVQCKFRLIFQDKKDIVFGNYNKELYIDNNILKFYVESKHVITSCVCDKIFKKTCFEDKDMRFPQLYFEDYEFIMKLVPKLKSIALITSPLYNCFQRDDSVMHTFSKKHVDDLLQIVKNLEDYYNKLNDQAYKDLSIIEKNKTLKSHVIMHLASKTRLKEYQKLLNIIDDEYNTIQWKVHVFLLRLRFRFPLLFMPLLLIMRLRNIRKSFLVT